VKRLLLCDTSGAFTLLFFVYYVNYWLISRKVLQVRVFEKSVSFSCKTHVSFLRILRTDLQSIIFNILQTARHPLFVLTLQYVIFTVEYAPVFVYNWKFSSALDRTSQKTNFLPYLEQSWWYIMINLLRVHWRSMFVRF